MSFISKLKPLLHDMHIGYCRHDKSPCTGDPNNAQAGQQKENEDDKPSDISFAHAVVDPSAMMVILFDASFTGIAVIASLWFFVQALKTYFFGLVNV